MKTISIIGKMLVVAMVLTLATGVVNAQDKIYLGMRVPQLNTEERGKIGAETNPLNARGQLIFNTDSAALQYWDGEKWMQVNNEKALLEYITNNFSRKLGDTIQNYITNNFSSELGDTILNYITTNFTSEFGDTILNYVINNVTQELTDSIMANVSITGINGIEIERNGTSKIVVKLPEGQKNGQILTWDNTTSIWKPADPTPSVKQVTIAVEGGEFDTKQLIFYGTTSTTTKPLKVVSIEPVFSNIAMRRNYLIVESTIQVVGNTAEWSVNIENRNISSANKCTLQSVIISYICEDTIELSNATQGITEISGY
ncbi:MAG: hypothetical protein LBP96_03200 [Bacteroidales bacterium]|jgi:hypothetical protein|nr:hypothetical protein [Bacteroidales bacterium]